MYRHPLLAYCLEMLFIGIIILGFVIFGAIVAMGCGPDAKANVEGENNIVENDAEQIKEGIKDDSGDDTNKVIINSWVGYVVILAIVLIWLTIDKHWTMWGRR